MGKPTNQIKLDLNTKTVAIYKLFLNLLSWGRKLIGSNYSSW